MPRLSYRLVNALLVLGAAGGVGLATIQLAKAMGAQVVVLSSFIPQN